MVVLAYFINYNGANLLSPPNNWRLSDLLENLSRVVGSALPTVALDRTPKKSGMVAMIGKEKE
jgi:hypothetical protein